MKGTRLILAVVLLILAVWIGVQITFADTAPPEIDLDLQTAVAAATSKVYLPFVTKANQPVVPPPTVPPPVGDAVILVGGDTRSGCSSAAAATAKILDANPGIPILHNGDMVNSGTSTEFNSCYSQTWGRHKARTRPVPGNHEYDTAGAGPYYDYFGANAGVRGKGYYSFNVGAWHIVMLNSEISISSASEQVQWLKADLAANPTRCSLAMWHRPLFSSGQHGNNSDVAALFQTFYNAGGELVFNGHDHDYERFAPQTPSGALDNARGVRQIVIGTGGAPLYSWGSIRSNSQVRNSNTYGMIKLTLRSDSYTWQFLPVAGSSFADSGTTACH